MMRTLFLLIFPLSVLASPGEIITFYDKSGAYFQCEEPPRRTEYLFCARYPQNSTRQQWGVFISLMMITLIFLRY